MAKVKGRQRAHRRTRGRTRVQCDGCGAKLLLRYPEKLRVCPKCGEKCDFE